MSLSARPNWSLILVPLLAVAGIIAICLGIYATEAGQLKSSILEREARRPEIFGKFYTQDIQVAIKDLRQLADGDGLQAYLIGGKSEDLARAVHRAQFVSQLNPDYDKVRFLDEHGQEIIRVNANGGVVPPDQMQNKADRPFFQESVGLDAGKFYISAFDLNVEHGQIEQPYKPTIRVACPVFDRNGRRCGIYVINYLGGNILNRLASFAPQYKQRLRILNAQGYWLKGAQPDQEWGFMLPDRAGFTMAKTDPVLWAKVAGNPEGQTPHDGGYYSWYRIVPAQFATGGPEVVADDSYIVIASDLSAKEWWDYFAVLRQAFLIVTIILLAVLCLGWLFYLSHRQARRVLRENEKRSQLMLDAIKDYSIIMLDSSGHVISWNTGAQRIKGYDAEEIMGQHFSRFYPLEAVQQGIPQKLLKEAATRGRVDNEGWRVRKDGSRFWGSVVITAIRNEQEKLAGFVKIARDLTERKKNDEKIRMLNEELKLRADLQEAANKELEAFSYSVSHDLRAPLRHIHGFVEMLQKSPALQSDEKSKRHMNVIARAARDMGLLIDDLLAFSRTGRAEMHPVKIDFRDMIDQIILELEMETAGRKVTWDIRLLSMVMGDPTLLRLVWVNLIANALKYSRPRAETKIEIGSIENSPENKEGRDAVFYIRDNGVGFDMQYTSKLFGVFQRLHRSEDFEGTGIGLANVQRIISRHGGRVWAESKVDAGATFYFSLPINQPTKPKT